MDLNNMFNGQKLMDRFFRKVDNVCWDLSTGDIGLFTDEGIATIEGKGADAQIVINPIDQMGMGVPAFAQNTPVADVKVGDLISVSKKLTGWVTKKTAKQVSLMKLDGTTSTWTPPKTKMLDFASGVMVVRSIGDMFGGGEKGAGALTGLQGMMMPMMMMGGGDMDLDSMMPMMLMSQMGSLTTADGADASNPMSGMAAMMPMLMMSKMMGGNSGTGGGSPSTGRRSSGPGFFDNR